MSAILPISTTRVSDQLVRSRLTQQVQNDQLDLFRIQNQLSTGRRIFSPSEDAPSALRAITLQRNLERQTQLQLNLSTTSDALSGAGNALSQTSTLLNDIRGAALGVSGTDVSQEERQGVIEQVEQAIDTLLQISNSRFRDNFLFGGSFGLTEPFVAVNEYVEYRGNEQTLQSFVDTNVLFDANVTGQDSFGGISDAVRGTSGLSPRLTADTLLSQLNGGFGLASDGAIQIDFVPDNPGGVVTESTNIDLRAANTVGDVARLIEAGAPPSAGVRVSIVGDRLEIQTTGSDPGGILITEVGQGQTAAQLGIETTSLSSNITGESLEPTLRLTTQLDTLLGSRAQTRILTDGGNNDLVLTAIVNGASDSLGNPLNGVEVQFVDGGPGATPAAVYDAGDAAALPTPIPPTLTVTIEPGVTTAADVAQAINDEPTGLFTATIDVADTLDPADAGQGFVSLTTTATTAGGSGTTLDITAGLQIENGDGPVTIDTSGAETIFDLLETLNQPNLGLVAELNSTQTGIDVRTLRSGADFAIGENGGVLAEQLGLRTFTADSELADFNRGTGALLPADNPTDFGVQNTFQIEITDEGVTQVFDIDLSGGVAPNGQTIGVTTVDELFTAINTQTGGAVRAELATVGNGIVLLGTNAENTTVAQATGTLSLAGDTLQFDAVTPGFEGNQTFNINVVDDGVSGRSVTVDGNTINVQLGGTTVDTATLAGEIDTALTDFTVSSTGLAGTVTTSTATVTLAGGSDLSSAGADSITVSGSVAERLGFLAEGEDSASGSTVGTIEDRNTLEVDSAFNTLIRLRDALVEGDVQGIGDAISRIDDDLNRVVFAESDVGARVQALEVLQSRLEDEEIQIRTALSEEIDVDLAEAISEFTARQFALQASLQTTANLLQLSILDFI